MLSKSVLKKVIVCLGEAISLTLALLHVFLGSSEGALYTYGFKYVEQTAGIVVLVIFGFCVLNVIASLISICLQLGNKKVKILLSLNVVFSLVNLILSIACLDITNIYPIALLSVNVLLAIYAIIFEIRNKDNDENEEESNRAGATFNIVISFVCLGALLSIFFIPVCFFDGKPYFALFNALTDNQTLECLLSFVAFFVFYVILLIYFTQILIYAKNINKFLAKTRVLIYWSFALSIAFYLFSIVISFIDKNNQGTAVSTVFSISYIPLLVVAFIAIINSLVSSRFIKFEPEKESTNAKLVNRMLALLFVVLFLGLLVGSLFSNILVIHYTSGSVTNTVTVNGFEVLSNYQNMEAGYKTLAFFIYLLLVYSIVALVISISLFARKSTYFYKFSFIVVCASFVLILVLSFFGKYYEIGEGIQEVTIQKILESKGISTTLDYESKITSQTIYFAMASLGLMVIMAFLKPFSNRVKEEALDVNINNDLSSLNNVPQALSSNEEIKEEEPKEEVVQKPKDFDPCPAFSEIDAKEDAYREDIEKRKEHLFVSPNLVEITRFVVEYAKDSRLHLSYKEEDIAQFIAGLGSSKLSILQGMSGTGKTSLPKIFSEAILGTCDIVEVESSWKDKNELIGYYNEFSSKFTPKKFTQALYRAKFRPETISFIVLDEMNLSRIEYYFSDFLSLMENEEDKREINLLNVQLKVTKDGENNEYKQLVDGHTLKIPANVWFIGTANRDESTFEISDKVYDRAMTMNFNKRASKVKNFDEPISQRFLTYYQFSNLLAKAKETYKFDCESSEIVKEVEKIVAPFNISFGNRIMNQIESFVSIYCSCFPDPQSVENEAIEKILLTKVVQKLEFKSIENKEELVHSFEKLNLLRCAEFISKLNEDI